MFLGNSLTVPNIVNLPGQSGGGGAFEYTAIDNSFSMEFDGVDDARQWVAKFCKTSNQFMFSTT